MFQEEEKMLQLTPLEDYALRGIRCACKPGFFLTTTKDLTQTPCGANKHMDGTCVHRGVGCQTHTGLRRQCIAIRTDIIRPKEIA